MTNEDRDRLGKVARQAWYEATGLMAGQIPSPAWEDCQESIRELNRRIAEAVVKALAPVAPPVPATIDKAALVCVRNGVAHLFESGDDGAAFLKSTGDHWGFAAWNVAVEWHPARPTVEAKP